MLSQLAASAASFEGQCGYYFFIEINVEEIARGRNAPKGTKLNERKNLTTATSLPETVPGIFRMPATSTSDQQPKESEQRTLPNHNNKDANFVELNVLPLRQVRISDGIVNSKIWTDLQRCIGNFTDPLMAHCRTSYLTPLKTILSAIKNYRNQYFEIVSKFDIPNFLPKIVTCDNIHVQERYLAADISEVR